MNEKNNVWLYASIGSFFLMSISFLLMPVNLTINGKQIFNLFVGIIFWFFLALGIFFQLMLNRTTKKWLRNNRIRSHKIEKKIGIISFCGNYPAGIADCLTAISIIGLIISVVVTNGVGYICYIFVATLVFFFCMHCVFNGKIYYILANQNEIIKAYGSKNSEESEKE